MTIDGFTNLVDAVTKFCGVLVWPAVVLFVLLRFGPSLRDFFSSLAEFSLKGAGFEASLKRTQTEVAAALGAAAGSRAESTPENAARNARAAAAFANEEVTTSIVRRASNATIMWVDDRPNNNLFERHAFEALGINVVLSTSTEDALEKIKQRTFDLIISDMGRPPDPEAGYTLLDRLRSTGDRTPFIIYAGSRAPEHQAESRRRGALGCTNRPDELFRMVLSIFGGDTRTSKE